VNIIPLDASFDIHPKINSLRKIIFLGNFSMSKIDIIFAKPAIQLQ